jgi:phage-related protein
MWTIQFFNERVQKDINKWPVGIYADFLLITELMVEHGADLKMPISKALGKRLFELRCQGKEGIGRVLYCTMANREIILLHSFIKKTQKTPIHELEIAKRRMKEIQHG